jgi:hypothetical protein
MSKHVWTNCAACGAGIRVPNVSVNGRQLCTACRRDGMSIVMRDRGIEKRAVVTEPCRACGVVKFAVARCTNCERAIKLLPALLDQDPDDIFDV